jgi:hypothetical protein
MEDLHAGGSPEVAKRVFEAHGSNADRAMEVLLFEGTPQAVLEAKYGPQNEPVDPPTPPLVPSSVPRVRLRRLQEAPNADRFFKRSGLEGTMLHSEQHVHMHLASSHAVLDWENCEINPGFGDTCIGAACIDSDAYESAVLGMQEACGEDQPPPTPARVLVTAAQRMGRGELPPSILPLVRLVYLYTIETPPIYRMVNELLADATMWKEMDDGVHRTRYCGYSPGVHSTPETYFRAVKNFALGLIQALYALEALGILKGQVNGKSPVTLFRGLPPGLTGQFGGRLGEARWTTFCSTTSNIEVAKQFGEPTQVDMEKFSGIPGSTFFNIAWVSEFPEEGEWLMVPGVTARSWGDNHLIHVVRRQRGEDTAKDIMPIETWPVLPPQKKKGTCVVS